MRTRIVAYVSLPVVVALTLILATDPGTDHRALAESLLVRHEGFRGLPYSEPNGSQSIGYGTLLPLSETEGRLLLRERLQIAEEDARVAFPSFNGLSAVRRAVLVDMAYNLGRADLLGFEKMRAAIARGDFHAAADEMLDSRWAGQVGRRAHELAQMMRDG